MNIFTSSLNFFSANVASSVGGSLIEIFKVVFGLKTFPALLALGR